MPKTIPELPLLAANNLTGTELLALESSITNSVTAAAVAGLYGGLRDYNVRDYGAIGDGQERMTASISSSSTALSITGANFTSNDIGRSIYVKGAGVSGANLIANISSVTSATQVTLSQAAGTTESNVRVLWGTDNTVAFNTMISSKLSTFNQVKFRVPVGHYLTFGKISVPAITTAGAKSFGMRGETFPTQWFGTVTEDPLNNDGSIIQCLSQTAGDAIFKFEPGVGSYFGVSLIHPVFESLNLRTYDQPHIDGINAYAASHLEIDKVDITTGIFSVSAKEPSPTPYDANGLRTPKVDNGALTRIGNLSISGYWCGLEANEHMSAELLNLTCNYYGINFMQAGHLSRITHLISQRNKYGINIAGECGFRIFLMNAEHPGPGQTTPDNAWQANVADLYDPQNKGYGDIVYGTMTGGVGQSDTFIKNGGAYIKTTYIKNIV